MAVPTFVGASGGSITSSSIGGQSWVSGHAVDDIGVCMIGTSDRAGGNTAPGTHTTPTGFDLAPSSPSLFSTATTGGCVQVEVATKRATSTAEAAASFTGDLGSQYCKHCLIRGAKTSGSPLNTDASGVVGTAATTHTITTGMTTSVNDSLIVLIVANDFDASAAPDTAFVTAQSNGNLTNVTKQNSNQWNTNSGLGLHIFTGELATAGAVGDFEITFTGSGTIAWWCGAFESADPGGGGGRNAAPDFLQFFP
jgi:hypothetical protein